MDRRRAALKQHSMSFKIIFTVPFFRLPRVHPLKNQFTLSFQREQNTLRDDGLTDSLTEKKSDETLQQSSRRDGLVGWLDSTTTTPGSGDMNVQSSVTQSTAE